MRMQQITKNTASIAGLGLLALWLAAVPASADLNLDWYTFDGGGYTFSSGGTLSLGGSIGQPDAGILSGSTYVLAGGFWLGGAPTTSVGEGELDPETPLSFNVKIGSRNPFNRASGIQLDLPEPRNVDVRIFDYSGRLINQLYRGRLPAGRHQIEWDGANRAGHRVTSGVYLVQVRAGASVTVGKVVFLR